MTKRRVTQREIQRLRYYMDRMVVHATLTARHLDLPADEAIPALIAMAFRLAEANHCMPVVINRVGQFVQQKGFVTEEEWDSWQ
jgi:hypothetical protein